jgi:alpha-mannosidase
MKIHLVFNAHIDPVWLWPWQASLDEVLATCRSACDRLDAHPGLTFSRGEAWVYRIVEEVDPALFRRIRRFIDRGRWEIVGGWWLQPDCNLPSGFAMERQIELGKRYFLDRFGQFPEVGYNVDSFGHAATIPDYLRAAGQKYYVMLRPGPHEMTLPARLFRWRARAGGPEVVTFRLAEAYTIRELNTDYVWACTKDLPPGVEETMCFVGVGDHGGGPTERQIAWLREHWNAFPGHEFVYSTPARYFKAVSRHAKSLPVVTGELQMHAIGCYSVHRGIKTALRRAEHLLDQAERVRARVPAAQRKLLPDLTAAWEHVAFNHFHDTLCGTCLPSAYPQVLDQIGAAAAAADRVLQFGLRHLLRGEKKNALQRIAIHNAATVDFDGLVTFEPWRDWQPWRPEMHLLDAAGRKIPFQRVLPEAPRSDMTSLLFPLRLAAGKTAIVRIAEEGKPLKAAPLVTSSGAKLRNDRGVSVEARARLRLGFGHGAPLQPTIELVEDKSDTWSHDTDRFGRGIARAAWDKAEVSESGPLRAALVQKGHIGQSKLTAEWRVYAGEAFAELLLRVFWAEEHKVLKLTLPLPAPAQERIDGIMGGTLVRANDGRELPLRDWTRVTCGKSAIGIVAPDVYAIDGSPRALRLTLLRSPMLAHHVPFPPVHPRGVFADQGEHAFRFRFFHGKIAAAELERHALLWQQPLLFAELTHGMPSRFTL